MLGRPGALPRVQHRRHRVHERLEATDPDDRFELACHRRRRHVLDHRGAAGDERLAVTTRPLERLAHCVVRRHGGAGVYRFRERGGENDAWEAREPGGVGPRQGRRLATGERDIDRRSVIEGDDQGSFGVGDV